ncbi:MAG: PcfJ domain-containing protein [Ruminococcus flavefaciens]|nr:PcfJ domain-containing protein [Ruminococcus flavefaciens]
MLNRRGADKIKPRIPKTNGNTLTAFIHKDTLMIDAFSGKKYLGRYAIDKDGKHAVQTEGRWWCRKLIRLYMKDAGYGWYRVKKPEFDSKKDEAAARSFLNNHYGDYGDVLNKLELMEYHYDAEKRERAWERKCERIDGLMSRVPLPPDDFDEWCDETVFAGRNFLFHDKEKDKYFCTSCNQYHQIKKPPRHGQPWTCTRTGKTVQTEKRRQQVKKKAYVMLPQFMNEDTIVFRHFKIEKTWGIYRPPVKNRHFEDVRLVYYKGRETLEIYYGQLKEASEYNQQWWTANKANKRMKGEYCYPVHIKEILKGTPYGRLGIEEAATNGWKAKYNIVMYARPAFMEYIAKSRLERLYGELSETGSLYWGMYTKSKGWCICPDEKTVQEVLGINMQRFHRLKQADGGLVYLGWLQYEEKTGKKVPEQVITFMEQNKIEPPDLDFMKGRMSPEQTMNYLTRQAAESKRTPRALLGTWADYLSMAGKLGLDTDDAIVYRAKKLVQRHDECVKELNDRADDAMMKELEQQYPKVREIYQSIKEKYAYQDGTYTIVVPDGIRDIILEGRQLHHCVASSERYFERIESGESIILFLRKTEEPLHSYYTLEVEPGGAIRQKRTEFDRQKPDIKDAEKFLRKWQQVIKKRMDKQDREQAEKAKELRQQGFEELRKSGRVVPAGELAGKLLADVLEADLMEVG